MFVMVKQNLDTDQTSELADTFGLLSDPTRLSIVVACMDHERSAGEIAEKLGASPSLTSHHLRLLRSARILKSERRGKQVFYETGCISCHTPKFVTNRLEDQPEQSFQLIWPYTDMLLHDMGPGLADNRPEARAGGQEWRTPPLWGIGLTETVSGHTYFLHDGRARSLLEAMLWHGGEAETQKQDVIEMPPEDRAALIRFLESL